MIVVDAAGSPNPRFDPGERIVLPHLLGCCGRRIESLILSHDHLDHCGGTGALLRGLEVGELCLPPDFARSARLRELAAEARRHGTGVRLCEAGVRFRARGVPVLVTGPRRSDLDLATNDRSVSLILGEAPARLLVAGDLQADGESALLRSGTALRAEALVLSHHGSASGSSRVFLDRVRPGHALVSCGRGNRFGHPDANVCNRVRRGHATLWRTDLDGTLHLTVRQAGGWSVASSRRGR